MVKNNWVDHLGPFWTTLERWQACAMFGYFWAIPIHDRPQSKQAQKLVQVDAHLKIRGFV